MPSPQLEALLGALRSASPIAGDDIPAMRESMAAAMAAMPPPADVRFEPVDADGVDRKSVV